MTTPPQRPGQPGRQGGENPRQDPPTQRLPRQERKTQPPTEQIRSRYLPPDAAPTEKLRRPPPPAQPPAGGPPRPPLQPPSGAPPARAVEPAAPPVKKKRGTGFLNRQSIILIVIIIVALLAGGLAGAELYARHRADAILVDVAQCV